MGGWGRCGLGWAGVANLTFLTAKNVPDQSNILFFDGKNILIAFPSNSTSLSLGQNNIFQCLYPLNPF